MNELANLQSLRTIWLQRAVQTLAHGAGFKENLSGQLEHFYDLLAQSVDIGDPSWLDTILTEWAFAQTQTDVHGEMTSLTLFINELMLLTYLTAKENLSQEQFINLLDFLMPTFGYAFEKVAELELKVKLTRAAEQLAQVQKILEGLEKSKSSFIGVAAHELRTPLTLIDGYAAMLEQSTRQGNPNSSDIDIIHGILNGTKRLGSIINDMIDASLIDNHLLKLTTQPVWLNSLFKALSFEFQKTILERKQTLEIIDFPGFNEPTFADPDRLMQVFRNVLLNAVKFTPDSGKISINGRKLPGFTEIIISDTGIGIDLEDQNSIFDKFGGLGDLSLHSTGKTKFKGGGAGLGLHIAKGILDAHGGTIWIESPGYDEKTCPGSIVHILIPQQSIPQDNKSSIFTPIMQTKST